MSGPGDEVETISVECPDCGEYIGEEDTPEDARELLAEHYNVDHPEEDDES